MVRGRCVRQFLDRLAFTEWVFNTLEPRGLNSTMQWSVGKGTVNSLFYLMQGGAGKDSGSSLLP